MADKAKDNIHKGHRQKVKQRYYETGLRGMADHNVLEMLLFFGIPYKDTNEIAHELISRFGSFSGVLRADVKDLRKVKGMTDNAACLINMLLPVYKRYEADLAQRNPSLMTIKEVVDYVRPKYIGAMTEMVYLLCFDSAHRLIAERMLKEGSLVNATFDLRSIASVLLETNATGVILVHNHPNAIAAPSSADVAATCSVADFLNTLDIALLDHIIISDDAHFAMSQSDKTAHMFVHLNKDDVIF
ncbi:MAG: hypothetical protein NC110_01955 [Ruminococcus sp.]|nr:hypothetical protein [Ruminococcus sp.]